MPEQPSIIENIVSATQASLRVMVLDDDERILDMVAGFLEMCSLFETVTARTVEEAHRYASCGPWHCWVVDLYVPYMEDGVSVMRRYAHAIPTLVLSGQSTGAEGFECGHYGVVEFLDKGKLDAAALATVVYRHGLTKLLCPNYPAGIGENARRACDVLFTRRPEGVGEWSEMLGVTPRTLEQWAHECGPLKPNTMLVLFQVFDLAFRSGPLMRRQALELSKADELLLQRYGRRPSRLRELLRRSLEIPHGVAEA
jgi:CheY-like chemotaxis protein